MKESKFVKTKIAAGYLLLIAVFFLSVGYIYRVVVRFSTPDDSYAQLQSKRNAVNITLYHLYQAESYGQLMLAGYQSYEDRYRRELRTVRGCIDSLRRLSASEDSLQRLRLDSITQLIADKERRTVSLRRTIRSGSTAGLLDQNIRDLIGPQASIVADTVPFRRRPARMAADTAQSDPWLGSLLRRAGGVLRRGGGADTATVARRAAAGSVPAGVVKDTITLVLRALQDSVTSKRLGIYEQAWQEGLRLRYNNDLINTQIYRLILDFEAEDAAYFLARIGRNEAIRRRASHVLGGVAAGSVALMLLFVGILWRDVNRSNRYRRALEQANRDKEALLQAREKLMLAITHDIKAPLGSVMGYIDLLERLTDDRRQALYLRNMRASSEHLLALVHSLLDFYRLDVNKIEVQRVVFSPAQLFETIRAGFAAQAAARGLGLRLTVEPAAAGRLTGDAFHIRQIADNLISNALKFTDRGEVSIHVDRVRGLLVFSVRDTGRGIGPEERERIFGEFVRLRSAQGVDGFGLGLSIVDRLVKLLGGRISLESAPGRGSRFLVSIPVGEAPPSDDAPEPLDDAGTPGNSMISEVSGGTDGGVDSTESPANSANSANPGGPEDSEGLDGTGDVEGVEERGISDTSENSAGKDTDSGNADDSGNSINSGDSAHSAHSVHSANSGDSDTSAADATSRPAADRHTTCAGRQVLLVDDDRLQLEMTATMCRQAGMLPEVCPYPEYAAKIVAEGNFDVVLTDIQMPAADGFAVLGAVRRAAPQVKVVAVSAREELGDGECGAQGFDGWLRKPFAYSELIATLCRVCGDRDAAASPDHSAAADDAARPASAETPSTGSAAEASTAAYPSSPSSPVSSAAPPDFAALTSFAGSDAEAARSILTSFATETEANAAALAEALRTEDAASVRALSHKMLPIFTMLGDAPLVATLRRAERSDAPLADALLRELQAAVEQIRRTAVAARQAAESTKTAESSASPASPPTAESSESDSSAGAAPGKR